jgi:hypothetical protein
MIKKCYYVNVWIKFPKQNHFQIFSNSFRNHLNMRCLNCIFLKKYFLIHDEVDFKFIHMLS